MVKFYYHKFIQLLIYFLYFSFYFNLYINLSFIYIITIYKSKINYYNNIRTVKNHLMI